MCIIWYNAQKNVFSIRVHDYNHVLKDRYEREAGDKTAGSSYTWNQVLDDYLDQIRNKLDSVLFAMKEKERIRMIVRERKMREEAVVNIVRRCGLDWIVTHREELSVQGTSQHSRPQSVLHAVPQEPGNLLVFADHGRAKHRDSASRHPIAALFQSDSAQHFVQCLPETIHQAPPLHSGQFQGSLLRAHAVSLHQQIERGLQRVDAYDSVVGLDLHAAKRALPADRIHQEANPPRETDVFEAVRQRQALHAHHRRSASAVAQIVCVQIADHRAAFHLHDQRVLLVLLRYSEEEREDSARNDDKREDAGRQHARRSGSEFRGEGLHRRRLRFHVKFGEWIESIDRSRTRKSRSSN